jgi:hypothetical protein
VSILLLLFWFFNFERKHVSFLTLAIVRVMYFQSYA